MRLSDNGRSRFAANMTENTRDSATKSRTDRIVDESADWVSRIQSGEIDPDNCDGLKAWLRDDEEHAKTFRRMLDVYSRTGVLERDAPERPALRPAAAGARWLPLTAVAATVLFASALALTTLFAGDRIETAVGERRLVRLEDGSTVHLNVQSDVRVQTSGRRRTADLQHGEVLFDVASGDSRPFVVATDDLEVLVTGTSFQVTHYDDTTTVVVLEGSVSIDLRAVPGDDAISLEAGQGVRVEQGRHARVDGFDERRVTGWRQGWLYLDDAPVRELVDRLNRQYAGEITIAEPGLAESRISVAVRLQRREATLSRLEMLLPLRIEEHPGERFTVESRP